MRSWPAEGPRRLWSASGLGRGAAGASVSNQTVYTTGLIDKTGYAFAFDTSGRLKWKSSYGSEWHRFLPGARSTPTYDNGRIYVISGTGNIVCMDAEQGTLIWSVDMVKRFGANCGRIGLAESPLIVEDKVICTPGGSGATIAALDKLTGRTVWIADTKQQRAACSPILVNRGGRRIIVTMLRDNLVGLDAQTGTLLWKDRFEEYQNIVKGVNFVSPVYSNGRLYSTSGDNNGGAMHKLSEDGTSITRLWTDATLDCHHGGVVYVDGHIYGSNFRSLFSGDWVCLGWDSGEVMYEHRWRCKGSVIYADGMLYCYEEKTGYIALVRPTPDRFEIVSSFQIREGDGRHLAHPAIADGVLYIRRGDSLTAWDISAKTFIAK